MPRLENYIAEVTVSVVLRTEQAGVVAEYSVARRRTGGSGTDNAVQNMVRQAAAAAAAASDDLAAGVQNAERRRLK